MVKRGWLAIAWALIGCGDDAMERPIDAPPPAIDAPADAYAGPGEDLPIAPQYQALADVFDAERLERGAPNASLLLMLDGEIVFAHGFGDAQRGDGFPARATTLYRIASVTKMLTATALLQDVAAGAVDLAAPMTTYVPQFGLAAQPAAAGSITVEHLLTHQHGLRDFLAVDSAVPETGVDAYLTSSIELNLYQMAPAGSFYNYSNPGYYYAGLITERGGAQPYRDALTARVLAPLAMTRTTFAPETVIADGDYAVGATTRLPGLTLVRPDSYDNPWARAAGYAFSSVYDLAKLVTFLRHGNAAVLPDAQRLAMQSPHVSTKEVGDFYSYGYGLLVEAGFFIGTQYYDPTMIWHDGAMPGFSSEVMYVPSLDFAIITLAGADGAYFPKTKQFALSTYRTLPAPVAPPAAYDVDPSRFDNFVGTYDDPFNVGPIAITQVGATLHIAMPDLDAANIPYQAALTPYARDTFVLAIQGTQVLLTMFTDGAEQPAFVRTRFFVGAAVAPDRRAPRRRPLDREALIRAIEAAAMPAHALGPPLR